MAQEREVIALLQSAQENAIVGKAEECEAAMQRAKALIDELGAPDRLLGEWIFAGRHRNICDIDALTDALERAARLIGGRSSLRRDIPLTDGSDSVLLHFLKKPGTAEANSEKMKRIVELFVSLTGSGYGYDTLYDGELAYFKGDMERAAVLAHQAEFTARNTSQPDVSMLAAKLLANVARHRMDTEGWKYALGLLADAMARCKGDSLRQSLATSIRIELMMTLGNYPALPEWLKEGDLGIMPGNGAFDMHFKLRPNSEIAYANIPLLLWVCEMYMFFTGQHERAEALFNMQQRFGISEAIMAYDVYYSQIRGLEELRLGKRYEAERLFSKVIDLIAPDGLWMCISEFAAMSDGFVQGLLRKRYPEDHKRIIANLFNPLDNVQLLKESINAGSALDELTAREREVALLASRGMSNKEIANKLKVTEQTVKFHLGNIYNKLAISGRNRLISMMNDIMQ